MRTRNLVVDDEAAMQSLARELVAELPRPALVTLSGELGAGKSVIARAMLRTLGQEGAIPSPTYAIVESYSLAGRQVAHLDLYRLMDPDELHEIGFDDVMAEHDLVLIEWPENGAGLLPPADLAIIIAHADETRREVEVCWREQNGHGVIDGTIDTQIDDTGE